MFSIGSKRWPGISKVIEEFAEVIEVCGKLMGARGAEVHFSGKNLRCGLSCGTVASTWIASTRARKPS